MDPIKYKGFDIALSGHGEFIATVNASLVRKPSLAAMKKHIDKVQNEKFEPFTVLVEARHWHPVIDSNIKGTYLARATCVSYGTNGRHGYRRRKTFKIEVNGKTCQVETAYRDCPEVIEYFKKWKNLKDEKEKFEQAHEKKEQKLTDQIDLDSFLISTEF